MKLVVCGDLSITPKAWEAFDKIDAAVAFSDVISLFSDKDAVIVNLECAVTDRGYKIKKFGPNLNAPTNTVKTLKAAGVTDCMLSNNHILDLGREGMEDTLAALDECSMRYTGFGENYEDSRKNHYITAGDVTVAIVNVCEHEYTYATEDTMGARPFDEFETMQDIRQAKKNADHVIVIYHGGKELCRYPSPRLMKACHEMVRVGASAVFCQHSHCIGCYEDFEGGHILYGQGNFHFVGFKEGEMWNTGLVALVDVNKDSLKVSYVPVRSRDDNEGIEIAKNELFARLISELCERNAKLESGEWKKEWRTFCEEYYDQYRRAAFKGSLDGDDMEMFRHYLDCEAHMDVWHELFPTWHKGNELG